MLECPRLDFKWIARERVGLDEQREFLETYAEVVAEFFARPSTTTVRKIEDGLALVGTFKSGSFRVTVAGQMETIGHYEGSLNNAMSTYVLGRPAIQGSEWLVNKGRGRGLGDRMRDMAEEITGLVAVPHGRNFAPGGLSDAAVRSWTRRAAGRHVPGLAPDVKVEERLRLAELNEASLRDRRWASSLPTSLAISARTGWDVVVGSLDGRPTFGWAVDETDTPLSPAGIVDEAALFEHLSAGLLFGSADPTAVTTDRLSAVEADRRYAGIIREANSAETAFAERIACRLRPMERGRSSAMSV
jgi:hypothetical protein